MRQESNHRMNSGERDSVKISNSRAMGIIVLIALLFVFQVVTFVWQKVRMGNMPAGEAVAGEVHREPFHFNPNTITEDSLVLLGFSQRQAASIIKYRTKGGKFRVKRDFAKMYVVDSAKYAALERYILLPDSLPGRTGRKREVTVTNKPKNVTNKEKNVRIVTETDDSVTDETKNTSIVTERANNVTFRAENVTKVPKGTPYGTRYPKEKYVCNLNTADSAALVQLYGIGGYYARKILQYRERLGGSFVDVRQLMEIDGFSQEKFSGLEGSVVVFEKDVKRFSLRVAPQEFLRNHPYIGPYAARGIETFLRVKGKESFSSDLQLLDELVREHVISIVNGEKIREYLLHL